MNTIADAVQDLRYGVRMLRRSPGFAAIVVLTLAVGIGGTTAMISVANAVWWNPLPFPNASRLVRIYETVPGVNGTPPRRMGGMDARELAVLASGSRLFAHVIEHGIGLVSLPGDTVRTPVVPVSAEVFAMVGVSPRLGRTFTAADGDQVVVLSDRAWHRYFQADPAAVGQTLRFSGDRFSGGLALGQPFTVVGVMPPTFEFPNDDARFWVPLPTRQSVDPRPRRAQLMGQLAPGVSLTAAADEVAIILGAYRQSTTGRSSPALRFEVVRVVDEVGADVRPAVRILLIAVGFLLLIACANVANLLLARAGAREREMAIRVSLGATRLRLIRQVLAECVVFAAIGGVAGVALGFGCVELFRATATALARVDLGTSATFPRLQSIRVDGFALACSAMVAVASAFVFGSMPALRASVSAAALRRRRTAGTVVVVEVALATWLIVGGGLLARSFLNLARVERGFDSRQVLTFQVNRAGAVRPVAEQKAFAQALVDELARTPGVEAAAFANQVPLVRLEDHQRMQKTAMPGPPPASPLDLPEARIVSTDFLRLLKVRVVAGRGLTDDDGAGRPRALLVNETLVAREFGGESPVGRTVYVGAQLNPWEIVGVVADLRLFGAETPPTPQFFADVRQWPESGATPVFPVGAYYAVRTTSAPAAAVAPARAALRRIDPDASLQNIASMDELIANGLVRPRLYAALIGMLATLGVALAAAGVYGVTAFAVHQRVREIGIRVALGARPSDVLSVVMGRSAALTIGGIAVGLSGAAIAARWLESLVFGVTTHDPAAFAIAAALFAGVAAAASYLPARTALRVEPAVALRVE